MKNRGGYLVKRVFAFGFDFYLTGILAALFGSFINQILTGKLDVMYAQEVSKLPIVLFATLIATIITYVIIPLLNVRNQTIMQKVLKLAVVDEHHQKPSFKRHLLRFLTALILEGWFYQFSSIFYAYISILVFKSYLFRDVSGYILIVSGIFSLVVAFKDKENSRLFHDIISKTKVIEVE